MIVWSFFYLQVYLWITATGLPEFMSTYGNHKNVTSFLSFLEKNDGGARSVRFVQGGSSHRGYQINVNCLPSQLVRRLFSLVCIVKKCEKILFFFLSACARGDCASPGGFQQPAGGGAGWTGCNPCCLQWRWRRNVLLYNPWRSGWHGPGKWPKPGWKKLWISKNGWDKIPNFSNEPIWRLPLFQNTPSQMPEPDEGPSKMPQETTSNGKGGKGVKVKSNFFGVKQVVYLTYDIFPRRRQLPVVQEGKGSSKQENVSEQLRHNSTKKMRSSKGTPSLQIQYCLKKQKNIRNIWIFAP